MERLTTKNIINELKKDESQHEKFHNSIIDTTEFKEEKNSYLELLEAILRGIPDIIRVFNSDNTIMFFNEAGYNFYKKTPEEVRGKRCSEILYRKERCSNCNVEEAIKTKQSIKTEKYIAELNKFVDCTCNPVLDDSGNVMLIVEQLRDITDKKMLENTLKESQERYRKIVNLSPEAIFILVDNKIVLANNQVCKLLGVDYDKLIGESLYKYIADSFIKITRKRIKHILENKKTKVTYDNKLIRYDNNLIEVEISSSYLTYKGKPAIQSVIRNITEMKKGLNQAAKFQRKYLENICPIPDKIKMESVYMPARTVSGDFFKVYKVSKDLAIGIVGDVSGKGISAALSVSAFLVLFREVILISHDPLEIVNILNKKIIDFLEERYIAVCCFSLDFKKNEAKIVGAGINEFMFQKSKYPPHELTAKGSFLGMFNDSIFEEQTISFESGDRFYFLTDGLDFIFYDDEIKEEYLKLHEISEFKIYLNNILNDMIMDGEDLKDDSTLLAIEIK